MSRHQSRQRLAREFGATDIVEERGEAAIDRIKEMTDGIGADSVLECVGTKELTAVMLAKELFEKPNSQ
jgi:threonine dehydrogenase-like Zn-dependent dehydrogenase